MARAVLPLFALALVAAAFLPTDLAMAQSEPKVRLRVDKVDPEWFPLSQTSPDADGPEFKSEQELTRNHPENILRWGNLLALKLTSGGLFVWLIDMRESGGGFRCCEIHRLRDYWTDIGFYVVQLERGEIWSYLLISSRTADFVEIVGEPHRNPQAPDTIASVYRSDMAGDAFEVWQFQGGAWRRSYECPRTQVRNPTTFARWEAPNRAILTVHEGSGTREATLSEKNGQWHSDACRR